MSKKKKQGYIFPLLLGKQVPPSMQRVVYNLYIREYCFLNSSPINFIDEEKVLHHPCKRVNSKLATEYIKVHSVKNSNLEATSFFIPIAVVQYISNFLYKVLHSYTSLLRMRRDNIRFLLIILISFLK